MRIHELTLAVSALALVSACSRGSDARVDDALKTDLVLAAQTRPYQAQQFTSPTEQQLAANGMAPRYSVAPRSEQPVYRAPVHVRRTSSRRSGSRSSSRGSSSGTYYPSAPREPIRHTGRDAAIGAVAGAVIGATTSGDRVKGGLIGAAAGGILGGIIGHTVDVKRP